MGFSKKRNTSRIPYMAYISYKATNRSNTLCIARFDNAVNDICHRKSAVREVFRGSLVLNYIISVFAVLFYGISHIDVFAYTA